MHDLCEVKVRQSEVTFEGCTGNAASCKIIIPSSSTTSNENETCCHFNCHLNIYKTQWNTWKATALPLPGPQLIALTFIGRIISTPSVNTQGISIETRSSCHFYSISLLFSSRVSFPNGQTFHIQLGLCVPWRVHWVLALECRTREL